MYLYLFSFLSYTDHNRTVNSFYTVLFPLNTVSWKPLHIKIKRSSFFKKNKCIVSIMRTYQRLFSHSLMYECLLQSNAATTYQYIYVVSLEVYLQGSLQKVGLLGWGERYEVLLAMIRFPSVGGLYHFVLPVAMYANA